MLAKACDDLSKRCCHSWFQKFKNGQYDKERKERHGRTKVFKYAELDVF